MSIFDSLKNDEIDEVSFVTQMIAKDTRPYKHDLVSGTLHDDLGKPIVMSSVLRSQSIVSKRWKNHPTKVLQNRLNFCSAVTLLVFGEDITRKSESQLTTLQAPGGTGALRLAFDFYSQKLKGSRVWIGYPAWSNYESIANASGIEVSFYEHDSPLEQWKKALNDAKPYDTILLQSGSHNPTGKMFSEDDWHQIAAICLEKKLIPILDNACQGMGKGIDEDALGIKIMASTCPELIVASSFSKNFTLYHEQVGALSLKLRNQKVRAASEAALRAIIRKNYSAPSQFGASIVANILNSPDLYRNWSQDLREIRGLLAQRKKALLTRITNYRVKPNYDATGLFLRLNLSKETIAVLRTVDAVYLLDCGRISLAGLNQTILDSASQKINVRTQICEGDSLDQKSVFNGFQ